MKQLAKDEKGFSLIETLVSLVILSITATGVIGLGAVSAPFNAQTEDFMKATKALEGAIEFITQLDFDNVLWDFPEGYEESIESLSSQEGRWVLNYLQTDDAGLLGIKVTAYWIDADDRQHSIELVTLRD